ncbi:hypothetical protein ACQJBY_031859 [Aegilops geniculata]
MLRMPVVVHFVVPILEVVVAHYELPALSYLCEVDGNGDVLAGVEIQLPGDGVLVMARSFFFGVLRVWVVRKRMSRLLVRHLGFCRDCMALWLGITTLNAFLSIGIVETLRLLLLHRLFAMQLIWRGFSLVHHRPVY